MAGIDCSRFSRVASLSGACRLRKRFCRVRQAARQSGPSPDSATYKVGHVRNPGGFQTPQHGFRGRVAFGQVVQVFQRQQRAQLLPFDVFQIRHFSGQCGFRACIFPVQPGGERTVCLGKCLGRVIGVVEYGGTGGLDLLECTGVRRVALGEAAGEQAHQVDQPACRMLVVAEEIGRNERDPEGRDLQVRDFGLVTRRDAGIVEDALEQACHGIQYGEIESARVGMARILLQLPQHQVR